MDIRYASIEIDINEYLARNHHNRNEMYGCCDEVDVEFLLLMFCQLAAEARSGKKDGSLHTLWI